MLKLKEIREEAGMSKRQAAEQLGIPYNTYGFYERGDREPNIATLVKLADFFNCSVDHLIGRSKPFPSLKPKQYSNTQVFAVQSVQIKQVIETVSSFGLGKEPDDPARDIIQYWDMDGNLLGEIERPIIIQ